MRRWFSLRTHAERRLAQELSFHLQERAAELEAEGVPPEEAARRARRELGPMDPILEGCRDQRWWRGLDDLSRDLRYALRALRHAPVFTLVALLTLTLISHGATELNPGVFDAHAGMHRHHFRHHHHHRHHHRHFRHHHRFH